MATLDCYIGSCGFLELSNRSKLSFLRLEMEIYRCHEALPRCGGSFLHNLVQNLANRENFYVSKGSNMTVHDKVWDHDRRRHAYYFAADGSENRRRPTHFIAKDLQDVEEISIIWREGNSTRNSLRDPDGHC